MKRASDVVLGQRLKQARTKRGLTQQDLAGGRYTHAYVSVVESGKREPSDEALAYFCERLQMPFSAFRTPPEPAKELLDAVRPALVTLQETDEEDFEAAAKAIERDYGLEIRRTRPHE